MDGQPRDSAGEIPNDITTGLLLKHLPCFAYIADLRDQRILYANGRSQELLGYDSSDLVAWGLPFFTSQLHPKDAARLRERRDEASSSPETIESEFRLKHRDGSWRWIRRCEVVLRREDDNMPTHVMGIAEDVTQRKISERHLVRHHERLLQLLAYDIHDGLVQDVVGAQMTLESIIECLDAAQADCVQELILLRGLLRKAINEGRRMITELRPMIIDEMGVVEAIHYLVAEEEGTQRLNVTFTHEVQFDRLAPMLEGIIFRIVQESLNNVLRHAKVGSAEVRLFQADSMLIIEIEDRGVGFDPAQVKDDHFGLEGIRERARLFGGKAIIRSFPGKGTIVSVHLPIELPTEWQDPTASD